MILLEKLTFTTSFIIKCSHEENNTVRIIDKVVNRIQAFTGSSLLLHFVQDFGSGFGPSAGPSPLLHFVQDFGSG